MVPAAERDDSRDISRIAPDQDDIACFDGHIGAGADRHGDVRGQQRRRIVDAVADHRDALSATLWYFAAPLDLRCEAKR